MKPLVFASAGLGTLVLACASPVLAQETDAQRCAALAGHAIRDGRIDAAVLVARGDRQPIEAFGVPPLPAGAAYCRVSATLTPTPASSIRSEVWLPMTADWNGKVLAVGNGGYGGSLGTPRLSMRPAVRRGYVVAGTDLGHVEDGSDGKNAGWALNQPERIIDFGHRANHLTIALAKDLVTTFYDRPQTHAYFQGCSDGGREALMAAQRYPDDFDGIIAGAPANAWTRLMPSFAWSWKAAHERPESRLRPDNLKRIQAAALEACDTLDGLADGVIDDPRLCRFDPAVTACDRDAAEGCLTSPQLVALKAIYDGPRNPRTGQRIFPGLTPGGEALQSGWELWVTGDEAQQLAFSRSFYANFVFNDPEWSLDRFDFDKDVDLGQARMAGVLNADATDMSAFSGRGGKLILHHGWIDPAIPAQATIDYYEAVRVDMGEADADAFMRLFLAPGVGHCFGGPGPSDLALLDALDAWVEGGAAPDSVLATKHANDYAPLLDLPTGKPVRVRPVCAWPQVARWTGDGSADEPDNFVCLEPETPRT